MKVNCKICGKEFSIRPSRISIGAGKYCSRFCKHKAQTNRPNPKIQCEKNGMWKGENVRIGKNKPKPKFCIICKKRKKLELSNISGKYLRDVNDFQYLCRKCHSLIDNKHELMNDARWGKGNWKSKIKKGDKHENENNKHKKYKSG